MGVVSALEKKEIVDWELPNTLPIEREGQVIKYSTQISAGDLADMYEEKNIIQYLTSVQRGFLVNSKTNEISPLVNKSKYMEIVKSMLDGTIHGSVLTLTIPCEHDFQPDNVIYDSETNTIHSNSVLILNDGAHRLFSSIYLTKVYKKAKKKDGIFNPYEFYWPCLIEQLSIESMQKLFSEYCLKNLSISKSRGEYLNIGSYENLIGKFLMKNCFESQIETIKTTLKSKDNSNITTFSTLTSAIQDSYQYYKPLTKVSAQEYAISLNDMFNVLINKFPKYFGQIDAENRQSLRKRNMLLEPLFFYGYLSLFAKMYADKREDWKEIINKFDERMEIGDWEGVIYDKNAPIWESIFRVKNNGVDKLIVNNSSTRKYMQKTLIRVLLGDGEIKSE